MRSNQSKVSPTLSDELVITEEGGNQIDFRSNNPSQSKSKEKVLHETILSLSHKLDELAKVSDEVFRMIDSAEPDFNPKSSGEDDSLSIVSAPHVSPLSRPAYQISSLMRLLQSTLNFTHWGVFLLNEGISDSVDTEDIQEVVSSQSFEEEGHSKDFEKEVKAQYACGNITQSINGKKKMSFPSERGNLQVVPFKLSSGKDGFWAMVSEKGISAPTDADKELLLWGADLIVTCMENAPGLETSNSPTAEKTTPLEREKLFNLIQLSRAMVHEVNNSLQIILGRAQIARMKQSKTPQTHTNNSIWEPIEQNANRICAILKNFSDFLHRQSDTGTAPPTHNQKRNNYTVFSKEVNLHHILESDLALLQYILGSAGIELELKDVSGLPSVCGKPEETELILLSLIWGIKDDFTSGGYIQIQPSADEEFVYLDLIWREKTKTMDVPPRLLEFHNNPRFRLVSQVLQNNGQSLKFEMTDTGERKITWKIPVIQR